MTVLLPKHSVKAIISLESYPRFSCKYCQSRLYGSETAVSLRLSIAIFRWQVPPGSTSAQYPEIPFSMYYTILFFTTQLNDSADFRRVFNKVCQQSTKDGKRDLPTGECPACPSFSFGSENAEARYSKSFKQIADCAKHGAKAIANEQIRSRIVTGGALID